MAWRVAVAVLAGVLAWPAQPVLAQGFLQPFFGNGPPPPRFYGYPGPRPYPYPGLSPYRSLYLWPSPRPFGPPDRPDDAPLARPGTYRTLCVRLCDGILLPRKQRHQRRRALAGCRCLQRQLRLRGAPVLSSQRRRRRRQHGRSDRHRLQRAAQRLQVPQDAWCPSAAAGRSRGRTPRCSAIAPMPRAGRWRRTQAARAPPPARESSIPPSDAPARRRAPRAGRPRARIAAVAARRRRLQSPITLQVHGAVTRGSGPSPARSVQHCRLGEGSDPATCAVTPQFCPWPRRA